MSGTILIKFNVPSIYRVGEFRLISGNNEIREEIWEEVKNNPGVVARIKDGRIELPNVKISASKKTDEGKKSDVLIADYDAKTAAEIIKETFDVALLNTWKSKEKRKPVVAAIEKQLKALELTEDEKKKKESEGSEETGDGE